MRSRSAEVGEGRRNKKKNGMEMRKDIVARCWEKKEKGRRKKKKEHCGNQVKETQRERDPLAYNNNSYVLSWGTGLSDIQKKKNDENLPPDLGSVKRRKREKTGWGRKQLFSNHLQLKLPSHILTREKKKKKNPHECVLLALLLLAESSLKVSPLLPRCQRD